MSRSFPILSVAPTAGPSQPGTFVIAGDLTAVFQGKFYRQFPEPAWPTVPATQAFHTSPNSVPPGFRLIIATTFEVIDNPSYNGKYTVYTRPSALGQPSSSFGGGNTTIRVNEQVGAPTVPAHATNTGSIINVSTFLLDVAGEAPLVLPPTTKFDARRIDLFGRSSTGWGEGYAQNFIDLTQHFAGAAAPVNPFLGQIWYNTTTSTALVFNGTAWATLNGGVFAPATSFRHTQTVAATTWTIDHNLGAAAPFIVLVQFFRDVGGNAKMILPSDITFVNANTLTCTFSNAETGWALVRL